MGQLTPQIQTIKHIRPVTDPSPPFLELRQIIPRAAPPRRAPRDSRLVHCLQQFDQHVLDDATLSSLIVSGLLQLRVFGAEHRSQAGRSLAAEIGQLVVDVFPRARSSPLEYL